MMSKLRGREGQRFIRSPSPEIVPLFYIIHEKLNCNCRKHRSREKDNHNRSNKETEEERRIRKERDRRERKVKEASGDTTKIKEEEDIAIKTEVEDSQGNDIEKSANEEEDYNMECDVKEEPQDSEEEALLVSIYKYHLIGIKY